jgi:hypothetical protein
MRTMVTADSPLITDVVEVWLVTMLIPVTLFLGAAKEARMMESEDTDQWHG